MRTHDGRLPRLRKGRGAALNPEGRFASEHREAVDDDWAAAADAAPVAPLLTDVVEEHARSIVSSNDSPDVPFTQSVTVPFISLYRQNSRIAGGYTVTTGPTPWLSTDPPGRIGTPEAGNSRSTIVEGGVAVVVPPSQLLRNCRGNVGARL